MKAITLILLALTSFNLFAIDTSIDEKSTETISAKLYSHQGYPYKQLINRANQVKLSFTESKAKKLVTCRVNVALGNEVFDSPKVTVTNAAFTEKPLASCLARNQAKAWLAASFARKRH
ncbi:hypothetical protein DXX93_12610 [Thalassotalea euphylliae]|uniref:Uncharacterized protein n=1 Tax=Thalassotalea euphylliae TaxID=1655234 RepID=A0A3E0TTL5_9GAMM|nr:hypothetical protein [Thalassotalea euphylliae]REL27322.1 hypothetical protein DXX93_12610 [Thalassotalea euphylliae]